MPETRTGPLVKKLVGGIREDIQDATRGLREGRALLDDLAGETKGVNGLAAFLRSKVNELDAMIAALEKEAADVEAKLVGAPRAEIVQTVNPEKAGAVKAARSA